MLWTQLIPTEQRMKQNSPLSTVPSQFAYNGTGHGRRFFQGCLAANETQGISPFQDHTTGNSQLYSPSMPITTSITRLSRFAMLLPRVHRLLSCPSTT